MTTTQIYAYVFDHNAGTGNAGILRVNQQVHDEALAVLLEQHTFVLVLISGSPDLTKALIPTSARTGRFVTRFKHFNMRISVADNTCRTPTKTCSILVGKPSYIDFITAVMLDDSEWLTHVPSYRDLSWLVDLSSTTIAKSAMYLNESHRDTTEKFLLQEMRRKLWDYPRFRITNASNTALAQSVAEGIKKERWTSTDHFITTLNAVWKQANTAMGERREERREEEALSHYMTLRSLLSSTARSPQARNILDNGRFITVLYVFVHYCSASLAEIFVQRAERSEILRRTHADLAAKHSMRAILAVEDHPTVGRQVGVYSMAQAYYRLAMSNRMLGRLDVAYKTISHSLELIPRDAIYLAELGKIKHLMGQI